MLEHVHADHHGHHVRGQRGQRGRQREFLAVTEHDVCDLPPGLPVFFHRVAGHALVLGIVRELRAVQRDELVADQDTVKKVSRRWSEYFPEGGVEGEEDPLGYAGFLRLP